MPAATPTQAQAQAPYGMPAATPTQAQAPYGMPAATPTPTQAPAGMPAATPTQAQAPSRMPAATPTPTQAQAPYGVPAATPTQAQAPAGMPAATQAQAQAQAPSGNDSLMTQLAALIDTNVTQRVAAWGAAFYADQRANTVALGNRIDTVVDAFVTSCSFDFSDDISDVQMPANQATMLDQLRQSRPDIFGMLSDRANGVVAGDPLTRKDLVKAAIEDVIALAGGNGA